MDLPVRMGAPWQAVDPHQEAEVHAYIIEDDYLISQSLADMLSTLGFSRFGFARSEDAAIMGAKGSERIDLITADVRLLPGDGVRAVETICKRQSIPVIYITGYAEELHDRLADRAGITVVRKPIDQEALAGAVREVLGKTKLAGRST